MKATVGFDSATPRLTVAAARGDEVLREAGHEPDQAGRPRTSELLLGEIEACVEAAGGWEQVGLIAVGVGPGSYTGIRVAVTTARALAQAREIPVAAVGTLAALARGINEANAARVAGSSERYVALPVLDGRRGQVFAALHAPGGEEIWPPLVTGPAELAGRVTSLKARSLAAGDGSVRFRDQLEAAGAEVAPTGDAVHRLAARHLCALGQRVAASPPDRIEPIYLRPPDAETWLARDKKDFGD